MKKNTGRRMKPSFGYKGAVLNHSNSYTYSRRAPFSKIKEIYGEELERFELESTTAVLKSKELLIEQKIEIRARVRKQLIKERKQNIVIISFISFVTILILVLMNSYFSDILKFLQL